MSPWFQTEGGMRRYVYGVLALLFLGVHVYLTVQKTAGDRILRIADGSVVGFDAMLEDLATARLVFVGELHDQRAHHEAQLRVIRALHERDRPVAVGLEMFRAEDQWALDRWTSSDLSLEEFLPLYYANWNLPWMYYRDIFLYAKEHGLPMVGLNVPSDTIRQVARQGFRSLSPEQIGDLPMVRCEIDETYEDFIRRALGMHGSSGRTFVNFCEAQLVWDTAMAVHLMAFLEANPQHIVVVVAGSGHAWRRGIPEQLDKLGAVPTRVILPEIPGRVERDTASIEDADYLWMDLDLRL